MGRRSSKEKQASTKPQDGRLELLFQSLRDNTEKEFGKRGVSSGTEFFDSIVGLPMDDSLPMQYLMGVDVIPLHRVVHLVGPPGSFKSTIAWYFVVKFLRSPGLVAWLDTEHKSNPDMVKAILKGDPDGLVNRLLVHELDSLDDTLKAMQRHAAWYDDKISSKDVPFMLLLDSLGAVTSKEAIATMEKSGKASDEGFGAARNARDITEQMRAFVPTHMADKPLFLLCTNHQKVAIDPNRPSYLPPDKTEGGGAGKDFASTCTIEMIKGKDESTTTTKQKRLIMQTKKASLAPTGQRIEVVMSIERLPGGKNIAKFDWDRSLVELLANDKAVSQTARKEIVTLTKANKTKWSSSTLGLKDVHPAVIGKAIHENKEMVHALQDLLGVNRKRRYGDEQPV